MFEFKDSKSVVIRQRKITSQRKVALSSGCGFNGGAAGSPGSSNGFGGPSNNFMGGGGSTRFNPVYDRLEEPSIVDEWLSRDVRQLNKMFRGLYVRDEIAGPTIDMIGTIPWSEYHLSGIEDKSVMRIYEESVENFDVESTMPMLSKEFLTIGRICISCIYSAETGTFQYFLPQDPDALEITPVPIKGFDPKIDVRGNQILRKFAVSRDPRDIRALGHLPEALIQRLSTGSMIPLEPLNTIFAPRETFVTDWVGTSLLTRVLPFWALQKALLNSTLRAARRRTRAITHITAGIEEKWEPEDYELDDIASLFMQADEDPEGAIVVTRNGIDIQDVKDPGGMWKISDEWDYISNGKMRALGINEELLSGGMTFNNLDTALSFFMEGVKNFRSGLTNQVFHHKMFRVLARAHGFVKRTQAELAHGVRTSRNGSDRAQYLMPQMVWHKDLRPKGDTEYLSMLRDLKEMGIPVPLARLAAAGDMDIDKLIRDMDKDIHYQKKIKEYKDKIKEAGGSEEGEEEGGGGMGAFGHFIDKQKVWDGKNKFLGVSKHDMNKVVHGMIKSGNLHAITSNPEQLNKTLSERFGDDREKIAVARYVLARTGIVDRKLVGTPEYAEEMGKHILAVNSKKGKINHIAINSEFDSLSTFIQNKPKLDSKQARELAKVCAKLSNREKVKSTNIWSGNKKNLPILA